MWSSQIVSKVSRPPDVLASIIERKRLEVAAAKASVSSAEIEARIVAGNPPRGFESQIRKHIAAGRSAVIAECKKASPSKGIIREDYDVAEIAKSYQAAGASCLSVLTDRDFFQGSPEHLAIARQACHLPVLRKDFVIDSYQLAQSRAIGADCILLIVAVLSLTEILELTDEAYQLGLDVLVEVHSFKELETALRVERGMLGINNRNLKTFETSLETSIELCREVPADRIVVSESGIHQREHIARLKSAGINAFLIGESFMKARDPGEALARIFAAESFVIESGAVA